MTGKHAVQLAAVLALAAALPARAQDARIEELDRKIGVLSEEIERLKLGSAAEEPAELKSILGFGPAASKVYQKSPRRVSIGGYGEMLYQNFQGRRQNDAVAAVPDRVDFLRAILYVGYKFNDWITFNSEYEFEHANTALRGEASVEFAQLDFKPWDVLGFRGGLLLIPVGLTNEMHEPTAFHGARRPSVESNIYPTTWRDNGVGMFGEWGPLSYRSYLVAGLQAPTDGTVTGFSAGSGLRGGRSKGSNSLAEDFAWVARLDATPIQGVMIGGSVYTGQADQQRVAASIPVTFWDVHATANWRGAEAKALYVKGKIGNVDVLNIHQGNAVGGTSSVGSELFGGYLELAYNVLSLCPTEHYLAPFFRYERYDTQEDVPGAWRKNPSNSRLEWTLGLSYKPIPQTVVKLDHQIIKNQGLTGVGQTNFALGYVF